MAANLVDYLAQNGRSCRLMRLPHSAVSEEQLQHIALDRATDRALQVLSELGRHDGDLAQPHLAAFRENLEEIFSSMPPMEPRAEGKPAVERRSNQRLTREELVKEGLWLVDESEGGAGFVSTSAPPTVGAVVGYVIKNELRGEVRWIAQSGKKYRFGVEKQPSDLQNLHARDRQILSESVPGKSQS